MEQKFEKPEIERRCGLCRFCRFTTIKQKGEYKQTYVCTYGSIQPIEVDPKAIFVSILEVES